MQRWGGRTVLFNCFLSIVRASVELLKIYFFVGLKLHLPPAVICQSSFPHPFSLFPKTLLQTFSSYALVDIIFLSVGQGGLRVWWEALVCPLRCHLFAEPDSEVAFLRWGLMISFSCPILCAQHLPWTCSDIAGEWFENLLSFCPTWRMNVSSIAVLPFPVGTEKEKSGTNWSLALGWVGWFLCSDSCPRM